MKIKIISVGNAPPKWVKDEITKYISRLDGCFKIELIEIKSDKNLKSKAVGCVSLMTIFLPRMSKIAIPDKIEFCCLTPSLMSKQYSLYVIRFYFV